MNLKRVSTIGPAGCGKTTSIRELAVAGLKPAIITTQGGASLDPIEAWILEAKVPVLESPRDLDGYSAVFAQALKLDCDVVVTDATTDLGQELLSTLSPWEDAQGNWRKKSVRNELYGKIGIRLSMRLYQKRVFAAFKAGKHVYDLLHTQEKVNYADTDAPPRQEPKLPGNAGRETFEAEWDFILNVEVAAGGKRIVHTEPSPMYNAKNRCPQAFKSEHPNEFPWNVDANGESDHALANYLRKFVFRVEE